MLLSYLILKKSLKYGSVKNKLVLIFTIIFINYINLLCLYPIIYLRPDSPKYIKNILIFLLILLPKIMKMLLLYEKII
jgi:hypothetical protein